MKKRWSDNYKFTYHPGDWNDEEKLKITKQICKDARENGFAKPYVVLKGRLGMNNPNAHKYQKSTPYKQRQNYQTIAKEDAAYFDVYVYFR